MDRTIISYYGKQTNRCGYCKNTECSKTYGMHAYNMVPQDYQDLIDRGWRRSGHYCYKPNNKITCCPCYTIRCDANEFKLSKSHKKILKRMSRFLCDGKMDKNESYEDNGKTETHENISKNYEHCKDNIPGGSEKSNSCKDGVNSTLFQTSPSFEETTTVPECSSKKSLKESKPPNKKAKQIRKEKKEAKLLARGIAADLQEGKNFKSATGKEIVLTSSEKSIKDYVESTSSNDRHKLKIVVIPSSEGVTDEVFCVYRKYQLIIHNDDPTRLKMANLERFSSKTPIQLKLVSVSTKMFTETLQQSYGLYEKYQTTIHNEQKENVMEYLRFLQKSPLKHTKSVNGPACGYGSYHQQYWLDDKLIAVGVIDILPYCVSSVYFFYDPDYSFLSLGTYGSLREIEFVQELSKTVPTLKYYYMGYYIHSCPKMKYKGKLKPSYLLCPETYTWQLLTNDILQRLDTAKYQRFNEDPEQQDPDIFLANHLDLVLLLIDHRRIVTYPEYVQITGENCHETIMEYGKLVGRSCAHRMLYVKT